MPAVLDIRLFGSIQLSWDGRPHRFSAPPRTLPLLAYLLLHRSAPVRRDTLAYVLWPDDDEGEARTNLRRHIYAVARTLPPAADEPWLLVDAKTVRWNPAAAWQLDVAAFEQLSGSGARAAAAELYTGELLAAVEDEWLLGERERLSNMQAANLAALVEHHRARRELDKALLCAQRLIAHDPWREDAVRHVMALRYELGDRAGALAEYERFAERLWAEMRVAPMPETLACQRTIAGDAPLAPIVSDAPRITAADRWTLLPFSGRDGELERLREAWARTSHGRGTTVLIGGEAGIGKSRLVTVLAQYAEADGGAILRGFTSFPEASPYQAVTTALASANVLAGLLGDDGSPPSPATDSDAERLRLFERFFRIVETAAAERSLLIVLEDLHWAGPATVALLESLSRRCAASSIMIVGTYRDEDVPRDHPLRAFRRALVRDSARSHLALGPLDLSSVTAMFAKLADDVRPPAIGAEELYARSEGNPLFIGEMIRDSAEAGSLAVAAGIEATISRRLERLPAGAMAAAEIAAVIGDAFDIELLRETSGWSEPRAADAVSELLDHHIVRDGGTATVDYVFSHSLIRSVIYARTPPADLQRRHRRVGLVMEDLYPVQRPDLAAQIARHLRLGGEAERAAPHAVAAAERALALFANTEAAEQLEHALESARDPRTRATALLLREELHRRSGDRVAQAHDLDELGALGAAALDGEMRYETLRRRIALAHMTGDRTAESDAIAELGALARSRGDGAWEAVAYQAQGSHLLAIGRLEDAQRALEYALALSDVVEPAFTVDTYCRLADVAEHRADYELAEEWLDLAGAIAERERDELLRFRVLHQRYSHAGLHEHFRKAYSLADDLLAQARRIGDRQAEMFALIRLGNAALMSFDIGHAHESLTLAYEMASRFGSPKDRFAAATTLGILYFTLGDHENARRLYGEGLALARSHGDRFSEILTRVNDAALANAEGRYAAAIDSTEAVAAQLQELASENLDASARGERGAALRHAERYVEAVACLERSVDMHRRLGMESSMGHYLAELALAYVALGRLDAAAGAAAELVAGADASLSGYTNPQFMLWAAAAVYRAAAEVQRADELLDESYELFRSRVARIPDAAWRQSFARLWFNRLIVEEHDRRKSPAANASALRTT